MLGPATRHLQLGGQNLYFSVMQYVPYHLMGQ